MISLMSFSLIKELESQVNISVGVSGFDGTSSPPFLNLGFCFF